MNINDETLACNREGRWVPAIPEPYYLRFRKRCACGEKFWTKEGYRGHYALVHIYLRFRKRCACGEKFWTKEGYRGHYALVHILAL